MSTRDIASEFRTVADAIEMYQAERDTAKQMGFHDCGEALAYLKNLERKIYVIEESRINDPDRTDLHVQELIEMVKS